MGGSRRVRKEQEGMEHAAIEPLLPKSSVASLGDCNGESLMVQQKHTEYRALAAILGFQCLESIAYFGIATNLIVYFDSVLHGSKSSNAAAVTTWAGTCYVIPLIGAVMADTFFGNFKTISTSLCLYLLGAVMITLSTLSPAQSLAAFFAGLYIVAIGSGGVRSAVLPLGADQFGDGSAEDKERRSSFFSLFYLCSKVGLLFSSTLIVWVQENVGWAIGFSIPTASLVLASGAFLLGTTMYRKRPPSGSPLKRALQVLVAASRKTMMRSEAPRGGSRLILYEVDDKLARESGRERLAHTDGLSFLDKAAMISDSDAMGDERSSLPDPWSVCTVTQVEELKVLLRMLPICMSGAVYGSAYIQMPTTFVQQGAAMNSSVGSFTIPPASLCSFEMVSVMLCVAAYDRFLVPFARRRLKNEAGLSPLQRIGIGNALMVVAMATSALVEVMRLERARAGVALGIAWQLPQYFLVACSEVFCFVAQNEFFYGQAPETMKSMCTSFSLLVISAGNYLSSLIVTLVASFTAAPDGGAAGWLPDDLNEGHLDYYFWMFAALCVVNCACFFVCARSFTPKNVIMEGEVVSQV